MENVMSVTSALRHARVARPRLSVRGVLDFLAAADARYRSRQHLRSVDDHLLRDMGVTRADVDAEIGPRIRL
jgi:uncharacterized protein YjiS (DUF1127 family)